jgi:stage III sporulation protein AE
MVALWVVAGIVPCHAAQVSDKAFSALPDEYEQMLKELPAAVRESAPPALFASDAEELSRALSAFLSPSALLSHLSALLREGWDLPGTLLLQLFGILLLRALLDCVAAGLGSGMRSTFSLLCRVCLCLAIMQQTVRLLEGVGEYFAALRQMTQAYVPLLSAMYLTGGNVATATVNQSTLLFSTSLVSTLGGASVVPLTSLCLGLTLVGVSDGGMGARLAHVCGKIKRWYTSALALTMLLLSAVLGMQTTLAARGDSLAFKTVRFVVASQIPMVGGGVAEMLRSAAGGVSWLRSLVGIGGVIMLLALLLPTLGQVLLSRLVCSLGADAAAWLGCGEEGRLLGEIAQLYGFLIAVIALSAVTFFFSLVFLAQCAAAFG